MKSRTPVALSLHVTYKFTCSCDKKHTYIGMSSRHLHTRVREHLNFNSLQNSANNDHIMSSNSRSQTEFGLDNFSIIRKCESHYNTKIHEALLMRKHTPSLNRQLYAKVHFSASVVLVPFYSGRI